MKIKDVGSTALLGIAGALMIAAAIFVFFAQPETVRVIAQHIGLQGSQVGRTASETPGSEPASSANRKSQSKRASRSSLSGGKEVPLQAATPAHVQSEILLAASPDLKSQTAKSDLTVSAEKRQAVIKVTSMEKGHLVEKYMYLNGGMVLLLDGHLLTESLAQDLRH